MKFFLEAFINLFINQYIFYIYQIHKFISNKINDRLNIYTIYHIS